MFIIHPPAVRSLNQQKQQQHHFHVKKSSFILFYFRLPIAPTLTDSRLYISADIIDEKNDNDLDFESGGLPSEVAENLPGYRLQCHKAQGAGGPSKSSKDPFAKKKSTVNVSILVVLQRQNTF